MKKLLITALALVLVSAVAMAQNNRRNQRMNPAEMYTNMAENLAKQLKLKKEKAETFKLLYVDYQNARRAAQGAAGDFTAEAPDVKKMTDEEANQLIQEQFASQEKQLAVDKEFLPKFLEIITPVEAAQVFVPRLSMGSMMGGNMGNMMRGMGGGLIASILAAGAEVLAEVSRLVLQPMNDAAALRQWLYDNGWHIVEESLATADGRLYEIIAAEPGTEETPEPWLLTLGPVLWRDRPPLFARHVKAQTERLRRILYGMEKSETARESEAYRKIAGELSEIERRLKSGEERLV